MNSTKTNEILAKLEADGHIRVLPPLPTTERPLRPLAEVNPELAARKQVELDRKLAGLSATYNRYSTSHHVTTARALPVRQSNGWQA